MKRTYFLILFLFAMRNCTAMVKNVITVKNETNGHYKIFTCDSEKSYPEKYVPISPDGEKVIVIEKDQLCDYTLSVNEADYSSSLFPLLAVYTHSSSSYDKNYHGLLKGRPDTMIEKDLPLGRDSTLLAATIQSRLVLKGEKLRTSQFLFIK